MRRPRSNRSSRDFIRLWTGEGFGAFGNSLAAFSIPLLAVTVLNATPLAVGVLTTAAWIPWILLGLPAGAWLDRGNVKRIVVASLAASATVYGVVVAALLADRLSVGVLFFLVFATGVFQVFSKLGTQLLIPVAVPRENLVSANAKLRGTESVAELGGPSIGGAALQLIGAAGALGMTFCMLILASVNMQRLKYTQQESSSTLTTVRSDIGQAVKFTLSDRYLRWLTLTGAVTNMALIGYQAIQIPYLIYSLGASSAAAGLVVSSMAFGALLGATVTGQIARRLGSVRSLVLFEVTLSPLCLLIPVASFIGGLPFVVIGGLAMTARVSASNILQAGFRQSYCRSQNLAKVTAAMRITRYSLIPVGALGFSAVASTLGVNLAVHLVFFVLVLSGLAILGSPFRRLRDFPESSDGSDSMSARDSA